MCLRRRAAGNCATGAGESVLDRTRRGLRLLARAPRARPAEDRTGKWAPAPETMLGDRAADDALRRSFRGPRRTRPKRPSGLDPHSIIGPNRRRPEDPQSLTASCRTCRSPAGQDLVSKASGSTAFRPTSSPLARGEPHLPEHPAVPEFVTAMENLLVGMHLHLRSHWWGALINSPHTRRKRGERRPTIEALSNSCASSGPEGPRGEPFSHHGDLAYGEQQRLEKWDGALATRRNCCLLDEPTARDESPRRKPSRDDGIHPGGPGMPSTSP